MESNHLWETRKVEREIALCDAIIGRCIAEGVTTIDGVENALLGCVGRTQLIGYAKQFISEGRITKSDLIPLPESRRPCGPNPYFVVEAARKIFQAKAVSEGTLKTLGECLNLFDSSEKEFREELNKWEGKPKTKLSVPVIQRA